MKSELRLLGQLLTLLAAGTYFIHPAISIFAGLFAIGVWLDAVGQHIKPHE